MALLTTKLPWDLAQTRWASLLNPIIQNVGTPGQILGVQTNETANSSSVGFRISSYIASIGIGSGGYTTVLSILLPSTGDWELCFILNGNSTATTGIRAGIATAPNSSMGHVIGDNASDCNYGATTGGTITIPSWQAIISNPTTYYLTAICNNSVNVSARFSATRAR